jgi:hypothetical protein
METYDIKLDATTQELVADAAGDFVAGENDNEMIRDCVESVAGEWKEFPLFGVGILQYLNAQVTPQEIASIIIRQLKSDVFSRATIDVSGWPNEIFIDKQRIGFDS